MKPTAILLAASVASTAATGCSWVFVDAPPARPANTYVVCTESRAAPAVDTGIASAFAATAVGLGIFLAGEATDGGQVDLVAALVIPAGVAALGMGIPFLLSARYGFQQTARCRGAHETWAHERRAPPAADERRAPPVADPPLNRHGPCRPIPGVPRGGTCPAGQRCREGTCTDL